MTAGEIGDLQPRCHQTAKINRRGDMTIGKIGIIRGACKWLGVIRITITRWGTGVGAVPSFLPLALEALEYRFKQGGKDGVYPGNAFSSDIPLNR
jgi:hypothetical protein